MSRLSPRKDGEIPTSNDNAVTIGNLRRADTGDSMSDRTEREIDGESMASPGAPEGVTNVDLDTDGAAGGTGSLAGCREFALNELLSRVDAYEECWHNYLNHTTDYEDLIAARHRLRAGIRAQQLEIERLQSELRLIGKRQFQVLHT